MMLINILSDTRTGKAHPWPPSYTLLVALGALLSADRMGRTAAYDKFYCDITYLSDPSPTITLPCLSVSSKLDWYDSGMQNANWKIVDVATVVNVATDKELNNDSLVEKLKVGSDMECRVWSIF